MATDDTGQLAYLRGAKDVELRDHPVPEAEPGAVVGEVVRANVCGSELHIWGGHHILNECVLGHEVVCRIADLGDGVETDYAEESVEVGDVIAPVYYLTCQMCPNCREGEFYLCQNAFDYWVRDSEEWPHFHGTMGTHYYIHPEQYFYKVPDGLNPSVAAAANCALSQVMFGIDRVDIDHDDTVVIQGAGGLGINATAVASVMGAETIVVDGVDRRLERAEAFGADHTVDLREYDSVEARVECVRGLTDGVGADVGIEVAGVPEAFAEGPQLLRDGGRFLELGNVTPGPTVELDPGALNRASVDITTAVHYDPWYLRKALLFLDRHADKFPYDDLLDATFGLSQVDDALEASAAREVTRATIDPTR